MQRAEVTTTLHKNVVWKRGEMIRAKIFVVAGVCLLAVTAIEVEAANKPKVSFRNFTAVEVENFENPKYETKEPMEDKWLLFIRDDIVQRIIEIHKFRRVMNFDDTRVALPETERVLVLRGKILQFTRGSNAKRFWIGLGAGKGKIVAQVTFVDKDTGEVIWERKVDGRVIGTFQPVEEAINRLAIEVAKRIRQNW